MTLQFLDDLTEPLVLRPLRNQHRFQRARIVGKRIRQNSHGKIRSCVAANSERFQHADYCAAIILAASAPVSRALRERAANPALPTTPTAPLPITASLHPARQASGTCRPRAAWRTGTHLCHPSKSADSVCPFRPEHIHGSRERISLHGLAHQCRQALSAFTEVDRLRRHQHPDRTRRANHALTFRREVPPRRS